jgi:hypothetical protein
VCVRGAGPAGRGGRLIALSVPIIGHRQRRQAQTPWSARYRTHARMVQLGPRTHTQVSDLQLFAPYLEAGEKRRRSRACGFKSLSDTAPLRMGNDAGHVAPGELRRPIRHCPGCRGRKIAVQWTMLNYHYPVGMGGVAGTVAGVLTTNVHRIPAGCSGVWPGGGQSWVMKWNAPIDMRSRM